MKRCILVLFVGIGLFACASWAEASSLSTKTDLDNPVIDHPAVTIATGHSDDPGSSYVPKTYAILVGSRAPMGNTPDAIRGDLDVANVYSQLASWVPDTSNIKVLNYNWGETRSVFSDIQAAASGIASQIKKGDSFIFYYSGHGTGGATPGMQDYINPMQYGSCQDDYLASIFSDSTTFKEANKFFLIDSCYSEGMWKNDTASDHDLETLSNISFLASSSESGVAYAVSDINNKGTGFFTNAILPALTSDATFGTLLASATASSGTVTGFFKEGDGSGSNTGAWLPVGHSVGDSSATLGATVVPEPSTLILLLAGSTWLLAWRRR